MKVISAAVLGLFQLYSSTLWAAAPFLGIQQLPSRSIQLTWSGDASELTLEQSEQLGSLSNWRPVAETPQSAGGSWFINLQPAAETRFYRLRNSVAAAATIASTSPFDGESTVAVTRETVFRLSAPLNPDVVVTSADLFAEFSGRRLLSRAELSSDRQTLTLFYLENLPGSARVRVTLDGTGLGVDADGDGLSGGVFQLSFDTLGVVGLEGTAVTGHVFASEKASGTNAPLVNATITVDGAEETLRTTTDANGFFRLSPAPAGTFFVHIDGRTAQGSHWPGGAYYPFVGKAWEAVAGRTNNLAGGTGEIFLPLIQADALQTVSATAETKITFAPSVLSTNPAMSGVEIVVPPNSLFGDNGARGGKVGIAPVPADRLPGPLPPGLNFPLVITIQTDGASNFDVPVPVRFPNLPDPVTGLKLPPGAKTALWSFSHDTGRWEIQGSATISADGNFAVSDLGVGVRQPGWHGVAPGSSGSGPRNGGGPPPPPPPPDPPCDDPCDLKGPNYVACWDGYYERYLKGTPPTDPAELKKWNQDKQEKLEECDDKLKDLMECRQALGGPCGGPGGPSSLRSQESRFARLGLDPLASFGQAATLTELELSYTNSGIVWPRPGDWFRIGSLQTGFEQRGRLNAQGQIENLILAPDEYYLVSYYDPELSRAGAAIFRSANNGVETFIPSAILHAGLIAVAGDSDGDGLSDMEEHIVGTSADLADTDGDGISDRLELVANSNPLDGQPAAVGAVATVPTLGRARAISVNGDLALVGSTEGVSWFDVRQPDHPLRIGNQAFPTAQRPLVALTHRWGVFASAGGRIFTILDLSSPAGQIGLREVQVNGPITALAASGDYAWVGSGSLFLVDLKTGAVVSSRSYSGGAIDHVVVAEGFVYLICNGLAKATQTVHKLDLSASLGESLASYIIDVGFGAPVGMELAVAEGLIYVTPIDTNAVPGVAVLRDAGSTLTWIGGPSPITAISSAPAGSGKLLFSGGSVNLLSDKLLNLLDVSDPTRTDRFVTAVITPGGDAEAIAVHRGVALVADAAAGLSVIQFISPVAETNAPSITLRAQPGSKVPLSVENDRLFLVLADAVDNQLVREVEFFVDGQLVTVDGGAPFDALLTAPSFTSGKTQVEIRARATDVVGNATWSNPLVFLVTKETVPPAVVETTPSSNVKVLASQLSQVSVRFSEPLLRSSVANGSLRLASAGPDGQIGTGDDVPVGGQIAFANDDTSLLLKLTGPQLAGFYRAILEGNVTDLRGNTLGADVSWSFEVRAPVFWNVAAAGNWSETNKWNPVRLPGTNDFAIIDRPEGDFLMTLDVYGDSVPAAVDLQSLVAREPLVFGGEPGRLLFFRAVQGAEFLAPVTFASTTFLNGGPWQFAGGVTILPQRIVEFGNNPQAYGPPGTITLGSGGAASVIDDGVLRPIGGAVLHHTMGSTLEVRSTGDGTGYGFIDAANQFTGPSSRFVNEGLVAKTGPGVFTIGVPFFQNLGVLEVRTGTLSIISPFGQAGEIAQDGVLRIAPGAIAEFRQFKLASFSMGRLARVEGTGKMIFGAPTTVDCPFEFAGETRLEQNVKFTDRVRTAGPWSSQLGCEFAGLSVELTGPVEFNGGVVQFNQATEALLPAVNITRDTKVAGRRGATFAKGLTLEAAKLTVECPVRFDAPILIKNDLSAFNANGSVEFASPTATVWSEGNVNLTGARSRILSNGVFEASAAGTLSARGFRNEGTFRKVGAATTTLSLVKPAAGEFSFVNAGLLEVVSGSLEASPELGTFQNSGTARFQGGRFLLRTEYNQASGQTILAGGTLATRTVVRIAGGEMTGTGTVVCASLNVANGATLTPGAPLGSIQVTGQLDDQTIGAGDLILANTSRVVLELGGRNPGLDYDQVVLTGTALLRGTLELRLLNGFTPDLGEEFTLLTAKTRGTSKFTIEDLASPGAGKKFEIIYEPTAVKARVVSAP